MANSHSPLKFEFQVPPNGRLEVDVPLPAGSQVTVFVVEQSADHFDDLTAAAASSLSFWDNSYDDEDWNNA